MRTREIYIGLQHGHLTVIREAGRTRHGIQLFECVCECGKVAKLRPSHFSPTRRFCSCQCPLLRKERGLNLAGQKFHRWTVLECAGIAERSTRWLCRCDCGVERVLRGAMIVSGQSMSCGCLLKDHRSTGRTPEEEMEVRRLRSRLSNRKNPARVKANKIKYETKRANATPAWLTEFDWKVMNDMYKAARKLTRDTGIKFQVDHILPINGVLVSGLHVPSNLQILSQVENVKKSNIYADLLGD